MKILNKFKKKKYELWPTIRDAQPFQDKGPKKKEKE